MNVMMKLRVIFIGVSLCAMVAACSSAAGDGQKDAIAVEQGGSYADANYEVYSAELGVFIKLDTRTGQLWQVRYNAAGECMVDELNTKPFVQVNAQESGRFALYPSVDKFSYILLDKKDGRTWLVRWAVNKDHQAVIPLG